MKKLVWLLVLINISLLAYFNKDIILPNAPLAKMASIQPEKISLLTQQQIDALQRKSSAPSNTTTEAAITPPTANTTVTTNATSVSLPVKSACYEWGVFSAVNLSGAQSAISNLSLKATVKKQSPLEAKRYWVYKPPLKSVEAAQAKALELKSLGVDEIYVVQEARWKNAISFGVFEDEQLATNLLNELREKGVKDVVKSLRNQGKGHASLQFSKLTDTEVLAIKKLKSDFPEADVKEITCN
jgi:hypothetical protein